ncbi:hypothetical protein BJ944DRAFT_270416 [Cunninghamella echinulata]|nr:hypothetical protein BJ944DRAFT_270416 [Cunninghamella echinulata]
MSTQTKLKRFSLANLTQKFNNINNNIDNNNNTNTNTNKKRQERTQSLYIKPTKISEDELPKKSHTQHIKKTIRRSLSVIMYATPLPSPPTSASASPKESQNHLVPVLVTSKVVDEDPSMLLSPPPLPPSSTISPSTTTTTTNTPLSSSKKPCLEYDNTMIIELLSPKKKEDVEDEKKDDDLLLLWQGYGFIMPSKITSDNDINNNNTLVLDEASLMASFEKDIWSTYKGLIHPVHLIDLNENDRWKHLSVMELKRYYDNYGSMMLKQREWRKEQQCLHYIPTFKQQV